MGNLSSDSLSRKGLQLKCCCVAIDIEIPSHGPVATAQLSLKELQPREQMMSRPRERERESVTIDRSFGQNPNVGNPIINVN
jgi:hypothetical protein